MFRSLYSFTVDNLCGRFLIGAMASMPFGVVRGFRNFANCEKEQEKKNIKMELSSYACDLPLSMVMHSGYMGFTSGLYCAILPITLPSTLYGFYNGRIKVSEVVHYFIGIDNYDIDNDDNYYNNYDNYGNYGNNNNNDNVE